MAPIDNREELCSRGDDGRGFLIDIVDHALEAVHPNRLVPERLTVAGDAMTIDGTSYDLEVVNDLVVVGAGKGSLDLVAAVRDVLGETLTRGLVVEKHGQGRSLDGVEVLEAGHPVPDTASRRAGRAVLELARDAGPDDLVLVCLTGGASALLAQPVETITLEDLRATNRALLTAGAPIEDVNTVRKHLSQLKGGRLAQTVAPATVCSHIVVDEVGGEPWGPTVPDSTTFADAVEVLERHGLVDAVPGSVRDFLEANVGRGERETPGPNALASVDCQTVVLADATDVCEAAQTRAEALGAETVILSTMLEGESREVGRALAGVAREIVAHHRPVAPPCAIVTGGETTVTIDDSDSAGEGGPNQEFALGFALGVDGLQRVTAIAVGTDGTDGPTDLAGGVVDGRTVTRAAQQGLDVHRALAEHDASSVLRTLGDAVHTGPTGTNLMDLRVVVVRD